MRTKESARKSTGGRPRPWFVPRVYPVRLDARQLRRLQRFSQAAIDLYNHHHPHGNNYYREVKVVKANHDDSGQTYYITFEAEAEAEEDDNNIDEAKATTRAASAAVAAKAKARAKAKAKTTLFEAKVNQNIPDRATDDVSEVTFVRLKGDTPGEGFEDAGYYHEEIRVPLC